MKQYNYVYKITNLVNGKIYIGKHSTDNLDDNYMGSGTRLRQAYKKYGLECFIKEVIDYYTTEVELNQGEIYWIAKFNSTDPKIGYNLTYGGEGEIPTKETKKKMSESQKGRPLSEDHKTKLRKPHKMTYTKTEEHRRKLSESLKGKLVGRHLSDETKQKISETNKGKPSSMKGKKHSDETKQKLSVVLKGKYCGENSPNYGKHLSEEHRRKISQSLKGVLKGKSLSEETKRKLSETHKGKPSPRKGKHHSEESKQKMSESAKLMWQRRKQGV